MRIRSSRKTLAWAAGALLVSSLGASVSAQLDTAGGPASEVSKPTVGYSGTLWRKGKYDVHGTYRIEQRPEGRFLALGDDFQTREGPDLKVVLNPLPAERVTKRNALSDAIVLGVLDHPRGASEFTIPDDVDLSRLGSVVIHCEEYTVLWGAVDLTEGEIVATASNWTKKNGKTRGRVEIARTESGLVLRLDENFDTKSAPDLKIVLSPLTASNATNDNALRGGTVISPLAHDEGALSFSYAGAIDLSKFRSVLIYCEQYTKLWAIAPLERTRR